MKVGTDRQIPKSACMACGYEMDGATAVGADAMPKPGDITVCIRCGHIMAFDVDVKLRDLRDDEVRMVAGDKRIVAIQQARAAVNRDRAYCEDFVRDVIKKKRSQCTVEEINKIVDKIYFSVPKPPRQPR